MATQEWCTTLPSSGTGASALQVGIARNPGRNARQAVITLNPENLSDDDLAIITSQPIANRQVTVNQAGAPATVSLDKQSFNVTKLSQTIEITGKGNVQEIEASVATGDWLSIQSVQYSLNQSTWYDCTNIPVPDDPGATTEFYFRINVQIQENTVVSNTRTGNITVNGKTVTIVQGSTEATFSLSTESHTFDGSKSSDSFTVNVYSNTNWKVAKTTWTFPGTNDTVTVQTTGTTGTGSAKITCNGSTSMVNQSLEITFQTVDGSISKTFTVTLTPGVFPDFNEDFNDDFLAL